MKDKTDNEDPLKTYLRMIYGDKIDNLLANSGKEVEDLTHIINKQDEEITELKRRLNDLRLEFLKDRHRKRKEET